MFLAALTIGVVGVQSAGAAGGPDAVPVGNGAVTPVAIVNGKPIDSELATIMSRDLAAAGQPVNAQTDQAVAERLVVNELLVQEAVKAGLDKNPELAARAEMLGRDVLANAYLQSYLTAHPVSDTQIRAEYERRKAGLIGAKEYRLRHILVADETVAGDIIQKIGAGRQFEQLVDDFSIDDGTSKSYGGSLGWVSMDNTDKTLIDAAARLKSGEYSSKPVRTRAGWHVLKLDGVRNIRVLPFEAVKDRLGQQLLQQVAQNLTQELRAKASVVWNEGKGATTAVDR